MSTIDSSEHLPRVSIVASWRYLHSGFILPNDDWSLNHHKTISSLFYHAPLTCVRAPSLHSSLHPRSSSILLFFNRSTSTSLPAQSFWGKLKPKNKEGDLRQQAAQMAMTRQRLLTLVFGEQETLHLVRIWSHSYYPPSPDVPRNSCQAPLLCVPSCESSAWSLMFRRSSRILLEAGLNHPPTLHSFSAFLSSMHHFMLLYVSKPRSTILG